MAEILVVGEPERTRELRSILRKDGHAITRVPRIADWRVCEREVLPQLVLAAMPSGDRVLSAAGPAPRGFPAPILFVHHDVEPYDDIYLDERFVDRIQSPFTSEDLLARVDALVRLRALVQRGRAEADRPRRRGLRGAGHRLAGLLGGRIPRLPKPVGPYLEVVTRVADWADRRDTFQPGHAERVTSFAAMIADGLGLGDHEASPLLRAAMLHDIGKVALPVEVLRKKGPLGDHQMRMMRTHPRRGASILAALDPDNDVQKTILYHHERMDGSGYYGLDGALVPRAARILAVAEQYDAMTSSTIREPVASERALGMLFDGRRTLFDSDSVEALADALRPRPTNVPLSDL
jgi:HD-GYP domain-containing protein (c-di-GMP phosphodiesterase class II)